MTTTVVLPRPRHGWIALASLWAVAVAGLAAWTMGTAPHVLRAQLKALQFWWLEGTVVLGVGLGVVVARRLARELTRIDIAASCGLAALALALTLGLAPRTNRIFYDEQIYQGIGQNFADLRLAQMCNDGTIESGRLHCAQGEYNKQPYAYPHLLSLAYRVLGVRPGTAFAVNAAAMAATVCAVYLLVLVLFEDRVGAFFAGLLLALTPEQILWSATASAEPSSAAASVAAVLATACFVRWRSTACLAAAAVAVAYAAQFRPESALIAFVAAALIVQRARDEVSRPRLWWAALLCLMVAAVHVGHLAAVRGEGWGTTGDRLSLAYVPDNLRVNGWFYLADPRFPGTWTALAAIGLMGRAARAGRSAMAFYFLLFFGVTLLFYAGSYDYGADVRYSLATHPAVAVLGGLGVARLVRLADRTRAGVPLATLAAAALAGAQFVAYAPVVRSTADTAWAARADVTFAHSLVPDLGGGAYVLTHNPSMFHVWGVSAGQVSLAATSPDHLLALAARYPGRLYLHWSFWCNVDDPVQRGFCARVLDVAPAVAVRRHSGRGQHYVLYRLGTPYPAGGKPRHWP